MKQFFKNILPFLVLFSLAFATNSCNKENELGELTPNNMEAGNGIDVFVFDSAQANPFPYVKLFYHIKYEFVPDTSKIYKILVYRGNALVFTLSPDASNAFSPMDLGVDRFTTYYYRFALKESDNTISKLSEPHMVYVP